jgi:hypothetical protein
MMTTEQIEAMVGRWIHMELEASEELRTVSPDPDEETWEGRKDILGDQLEDAWSDLSFNRLAGVEKIADGLLVGQGVKLDKDSTAYKRLCRELLKAKMEVLKTELKRMDGDYSTALTVRAAGVQPAAVPTKPFSEVSAAYLTEFSNRQPRTQAMIRSGFAKFLEASGGDKPVGHITKDDCRTYKESMTKDGLVAATVNKRLHNLSHCLTWAHGQGFLPEEWKNPVAGLPDREEYCAGAEGEGGSVLRCGTVRDLLQRRVHRVEDPAS